MFRNTPRSGTGESPAMLIFGHDIRDSLPCHHEHLLLQLCFRNEQRLFDHNEKQKPDAIRNGPTKEQPLLAPSTPVRIQNLISKKWDSTGFVVKFGINTVEDIIRTGHKEIWRNRHFLKAIKIDAMPSLLSAHSGTFASPNADLFPVPG